MCWGVCVYVLVCLVDLEFAHMGICVYMYIRVHVHDCMNVCLCVRMWGVYMLGGDACLCMCMCMRE